MYGEFGDSFQPWNQISFYESHAFLDSPTMQNLTESNEEEAQRSGFHQQISQYHEEEDKEEAAAIAMNLQSSVDDLFSDTMELVSYLHRRVQEIGKQFRHCPFRINGNGMKESPFRFLHGLPCRSDLPFKAPIAISQIACDPAEHGNLQKKMDNCAAGEEKASAPAAEKIISVEISSRVSFGPCFTNTFSPGFSRCRDATGRTRNHVFDAGRDGGVVLLLQDNRVEDAQVIPSAQRGDGIKSALPLCPPLPRPPSPENSLPILDHHLCLDPADALASIPKEEKNPISSTAQSPLLYLTPSATGSENLLPLLQHSIPGMNSTENIATNADLPLRMPSLQEHVCSDAEDPAVLFPMQKEGNSSTKPSQPGLYMDSSENVRDADLLRKGILIPVIQEHVEQQISLDAQLPSSLAVAENSSPQSQMQHSMSSVDSSECDNCGLENVTGHLMADIARSKNSTITSGGHKSDETDAMSGCVDAHKKEENDDEGTIVALGVDTACAGLEEMKNGALDLLLNAIQATSGGDFADNGGDDVCRPSSSEMKKHVLGAGGHGTVGERKVLLEPSSSQVIQRMRKAGTNGQLGFSEITHSRDIHSVSKSLQDIQDYTRDSKSAELSSNVVPLHVGKFPIVRKRSARFPKMALKEEPSGNSLPIVMRFKSLQAVSKVDFSSRKSKKKPSDNKQEKRRKRPLLEMQERGHSLHVSAANLGRRDSKRCLVPKQEKREKPLDTELEGWEREDSSSKQEKRARHSDDLQESQGIEKTSAVYEAEAAEAKDEEEPVVFSRRGRSQILPNKFSDSVLQPWKKKDRRKDQ